jgi:hypothetical protein
VTVDVETAFIIARRENGTFFASTNLNINFKVNHEATSVDVKQGCSEILNVLTNDELANIIVAKLAQSSQSDTEKAASSIRQALSNKGIL